MLLGGHFEFSIERDACDAMQQCNVELNMKIKLNNNNNNDNNNNNQSRRV